VGELTEMPVVFDLKQKAMTMGKTLRIGYVILIQALVCSIAVGQAVTKAPNSKVFDAARLLGDLQILSSDMMQGRAPELASITRAREFIERRFRESGIQPIGENYRQEFTIKHKVSREQPFSVVNFAGQMEGSKKRDKYIVVTAHYDHDGVKKGEIYNGTDDNASGTAALFTIADYFKRKKPDHTIVFVAFDAEELGLVGSKHFVENLPIPKDKIVLNINLDMIARGDKGELYAAGTYHYPQLKPTLERIAKKARIKLLFGHDDPKLGKDDWTPGSDHAAFHRVGIPFIYFGVEEHADYHKPTDDFDKVPQEFYVRAVETIIETTKAFDRTLGK
jgi:Zn-dependent M28 family amino/carboxypeptidase